MANKKFCVIGLGHFGYNLALRLSDGGAEVLAIDRAQDKVDSISDKVTLAVCMDTTDERALKSLGLREMDAIIVSIGEHFESSLMTTAILQQIGVKKIYNRVISPVHERILRLMKVDELLLPEATAADEFAKSLIITGVLKSFSLGEGYGIFEIKAPKQFVAKSLIELNLRQEYELNLVTINRKRSKKLVTSTGERENYEVIGIPKPETKIEPDDIMVFFGKEKDVKTLLAE